MGPERTIYVALLEEATDVWCPVKAEHIGGDVFRIVSTIPDGDVWQFQPGERVRCRENEFQDGTKGLVAFEVVEAA